MKARTSIKKELDQAEWIIASTLVKRHFQCKQKNCESCRKQGGHGPFYYLSICGEDKRTHMIYVPKKHLAEVKAGIAAYKGLKDKFYQLGKEELRLWRIDSCKIHFAVVVVRIINNCV